jgi:hypothetical protein
MHLQLLKRFFADRSLYLFRGLYLGCSTTTIRAHRARACRRTTITPSISSVTKPREHHERN